MRADDNILLLFDEMLLSEKQLSHNTRRAYKTDINAYMNFIHVKYNFSVLNVDSTIISSWFRSLSN